MQFGIVRCPCLWRWGRGVDPGRTPATATISAESPAPAAWMPFVNPTSSAARSVLVASSPPDSETPTTTDRETPVAMASTSFSSAPAFPGSLNRTKEAVVNAVMYPTGQAAGTGAKPDLQSSTIFHVPAAANANGSPCGISGRRRKARKCSGEATPVRNRGIPAAGMHRKLFGFQYHFQYVDRIRR